MRKVLFLTPAVAFLLGLGAAAAVANEIDDGRALVEANCARCHSIERSGDSPHPDAPPFRQLHERYPLTALEEAFAEGISTGHPDMPQFVATPEQITAILAYIQSLSN